MKNNILLVSILSWLLAVGCSHPGISPSHNGLRYKMALVNEFLVKGDYLHAYPLLVDMKTYPVERDRIFYNLGICLMKQKKYVEAIDAFTRSIKLNPGLFRAYINRAYCYESIEDMTRAEKDLRYCLRWKSRLYLVRYNLGKILMYKRDYINAIKELKSSLLIKPDFVPALNNIAICYIKIGNDKKAIEYLKMAINISSDDADIYFNLGISLSNENKYISAIDAYSKVLDIMPQYAPAYNNRGLLYLYLNKNKKACSDLKMACNFGLCDNYKRLKEIEVCN